jgi:hypothetical protein
VWCDVVCSEISQAGQVEIWRGLSHIAGLIEAISSGAGRGATKSALHIIDPFDVRRFIASYIGVSTFFFFFQTKIWAFIDKEMTQKVDPSVYFPHTGV